MSNGSSTLSKVKVGRLWGYPIIVTTGKSKHEAILLDCNTDNPQDFLKQNAEVKIRWKVAMYNDSVPASDVVLQDVDTIYYLPRKAALAASLPAKKRKVDDMEVTKPSIVNSGVNVKEEEIETDNDEDIEKPTAVPSNANIKEEEVETDNDDDDNVKPTAVTSSGSAVKKEEEIETDNDEDFSKPQAVTSSGVAVKTEEVGTEDDKDKEADIIDLTAIDDTGSGSASGLTEEQMKERQRNINLHVALIENM